jgi:hypothetical protein
MRSARRTASSSVMASGALRSRRRSSAVAFTWPALVAACRAFYMDYDHYQPELRAYLMPKARKVLKAAEAATAPLLAPPRA